MPDRSADPSQPIIFSSETADVAGKYVLVTILALVAIAITLIASIVCVRHPPSIVGTGMLCGAILFGWWLPIAAYRSPKTPPKTITIDDEGIRIAIGNVAKSYRWADLSEAKLVNVRPQDKYGQYELQLRRRGAIYGPDDFTDTIPNPAFLTAPGKDVMVEIINRIKAQNATT